MQREVYFFYWKPFLVKPRNQEMDINTETISFLPIWVQFSNLDINFCKIRSILGIPIKTDKYTKQKTLLKYARLLIDISLDDAFPVYIEFFNDHNVLGRQQVKYEWKPTKCGHCRMFRHSEDECRKKTMVRKEWRVVQRQVNSLPISKERRFNNIALCTWNIRSLNWPNKHENIKVFLQVNKVAFVGLLTKEVQEKNADMKQTILGMELPTQLQSEYKRKNMGCLRPSMYTVQIVAMFDQFIHCKAT
ncbi:hypothetical protein Cgig2_028421 [Carnegiea gigantea]|uniref:DUF4283 domain-containing protein n=1 Tax=Carnegiea gigantea TaxID=171969 RepID=A0A9Q1JIG2_9CARY|nr:hypothetical protein Cgig2_028421 [Carnegiea gigantea]